MRARARGPSLQSLGHQSPPPAPFRESNGRRAPEQPVSRLRSSQGATLALRPATYVSCERRALGQCEQEGLIGSPSGRGLTSPLSVLPQGCAAGGGSGGVRCRHRPGRGLRAGVGGEATVEGAASLATAEEAALPASVEEAAPSATDEEAATPPRFCCGWPWGFLSYSNCETNSTGGC